MHFLPSEGLIGPIPLVALESLLSRPPSAPILLIAVSAGANPANRCRIDTVPTTRRGVLPVGTVGLIKLGLTLVDYPSAVMPLLGPWAVVVGMGATTPPPPCFVLLTHVDPSLWRLRKAKADQGHRDALHLHVRLVRNLVVLLLPTIRVFSGTPANLGKIHLHGCISRASGYGAVANMTSCTMALRATVSAEGLATLCMLIPRVDMEASAAATPLHHLEIYDMSRGALAHLAMEPPATLPPRLEFEGGLVLECSRLGRVGNTKRTLVTTVHQFKGAMRLGRIAAAAIQGSHVPRLDSLLNTPLYVGHSTTTPNASPRKREPASSRSSHQRWRGLQPSAPELLPKLPLPRPAGGPQLPTLPLTLLIMAWHTTSLTDVS